MTYQNIQGFIFCGGAANASQLYRIRKAHINATQMLWLTTGHVVQDGRIYNKETPILIFLN